jgi:hypothetical protein
MYCVVFCCVVLCCVVLCCVVFCCIEFDVVFDVVRGCGLSLVYVLLYYSISRVGSVSTQTCVSRAAIVNGPIHFNSIQFNSLPRVASSGDSDLDLARPRGINNERMNELSRRKIQ